MDGLPAAEALREVLAEARGAGFLGPGPIEPHISHADGFRVAAQQALGRAPQAFADLGTGGGVPGLVLGVRWADAQGFFVESGRRRAAWLREATARLGLDSRVEVVEERAEAAARRADLRERGEGVTARSFAEPAVTAEIASGFVKVGGMVVVSEPPERNRDRWPAVPLQRLGLLAAEPVSVAGAHFVVIAKGSPADARVPRPVGRPAKRPLW